tara:strand:+ start:789 stop:1313 length:525 start_codon:yes stop_codon:yes gene_type:complete
MRMKKLLTLLPLIALIAACSSKDKVSVDQEGSDKYTEKHIMAMPNSKQIVDQVHGKELWFAIAPMGGVDGMPANGVTQSHYFEDGTYLHNLKLNVERPEDGFFYEGWVVHPETKDWVSLGHLNSNFGDVRHGLQFRGEQDLREYLQVKVTLEQDDGNPSPGDVVAEGVLKVTQR